MVLRFRILFLALSCTLFSTQITVAQEFKLKGDRLNATYDKVDGIINKYYVYNIESEDLVTFVREKHSFYQISLDLGKFSVEMEILPSGIISPDYVLNVNTKNGIVKHTMEHQKAYRGVVLNQGGGDVRLTIDHGFIYGFFELNGTTYYIEPLNMVIETDKFVDRYLVYDVKDVKENTTGKCGVHHDEDAKSLIENSSMDVGRSVGECYQVELAIASDFSMFTKYGSVTDVENRNIGVVNNYQVNFIGEFSDDIEFLIVTQFVSDCSTCDPWTDDTDSGLLLDDFTIWGNQGNFGVPFDVASLWTDRNFDGPTIGLAWVSGLCNNLRYHVLEDFTGNANLLRVLNAHELGHNFSALHDDPGDDFIMAPAVDNFTEWSTFSKNRINSLILNRANSGTCFDDCGPNDPPDPDYYVLNEHVCPGGQVLFWDNSFPEPDSWTWNFPGGTPSSSSNPNPIVTYNNPGSYNVTLTVENSNGINSETYNGLVQVDESGNNLLLYQDFDQGFQDWGIENPDNDVTWDISTVGGSPFSGNAARMNNFNYNAVGERDALRSPEFSLVGRASANLNIDYAYIRFDNTFKDSLVVKVSTDGGLTFPNRIFAATEDGPGAGSGNFATAPQNTTEFSPSQESDFCYAGGFGNSCLQLDLGAFVGEENVMVKIENVNGFGNNMFIDRAYVQAACFMLEPPIADFMGVPTLGCAPLTVNYTDLSTNEPASWFWTFEGGIPITSTDQNPEVTYISAGSFSTTLLVTNAAGSDQVTFTSYINVDDIPTASFVYSVQGNIATFTNTSLGASSYSWDFGDGEFSTEPDPAHSYDEDGTYVVTLTAFNDCGSDSFIDTVVIDVLPIAGFSHSPDSSCGEAMVQFTDESSNNTTVWDWTFEGGTPSTSTAQNPLVTFENPGTYDVTLIASNGFGSDTFTIVHAVTVFAIPKAGFDKSIDYLEVSFTDQSMNADSVVYHFGDGQSSNASDPVHNYAGDGDYEAFQVAYNICGTDTMFMLISLSTQVTANISANITEGCLPLTVHFSDSNSINGTSRMWAFEGGTPEVSVMANPSVVYNNAGSFDVTLIVSNGVDSDTAFMPDYIVIDDIPSADFSYSQNMLDVNFTNESTNADSYKWFFGDGEMSTEESPEHAYDIDGVYEVILVASNDCGQDTSSRNISIGSAPAADFGANIQSGCVPLTVQFENLSSDNAENFKWTFGGGNPASSSEENPLVIYETPGTYFVQLEVSNADGSDAVVKNNYIIVYPDPTIEFSFSIDGNKVTFTNMSTEYDGLLWDFDDENFSVEENPVHEYDQVGSYDVELTVFNMCDTLTLVKTVAVGTKPVADIDADNREGCLPATIQFSDNSLGEVDSWMWLFEGGEPAQSAMANPAVTYKDAGSFDVQLIVSNNRGSDTVEMKDFIVIGDKPSADFEYSQASSLVLLTNKSVDANSYFWDFGNDSTSTEPNPTADYEKSGDYDIMLIASNECGFDTMVQTVMIMIGAIDNSYLENHIIVYPNPTKDFLSVEFSDLDQGKYHWSIIDLLGKEVNSGSFEINSGFHKESLNLSHLTASTYFLHLRSEDHQFVVKVLVE